MTSSGFSSILKITDLDDFINPSQECIRPMEKSVPEPMETDAPSASKIRIQIEDDSKSVLKEIKEGRKQPLKKVEVSLTDCLACSGCITSAESVLISQQSPDELFRVLELNKNCKDALAVVSLGVQAVLSLSRKYGMSAQITAEKLAGLFKELGADYTCVITVAEDMALIESGNEFVRNYETGDLPIFSGICPGWVCYAEKLHQHSLPKISKVKSPQQIMGSLVKLVYGKKANFTPDQIYHVTLMSCFDRKLEASRTDFFINEYKAKEVDVVITAVEVEQILAKLNKSLEDLEPVPLVDLLQDTDAPVEGCRLMSHFGSGSGGYAEFVLKYAAEKLFGKVINSVEWNAGRNPDITDATVGNDGGQALKFSIATGFRNIQTLVRKLKSKTSLPHYVEIMACPTGCLNGGAQVRPDNVEGNKSRDLSWELEKEYHQLPEVSDMSTAIKLLEALKQSNDQLYERVLYTDFHAVEKLNLGMKW